MILLGVIEGDVATSSDVVEDVEDVEDVVEESKELDDKAMGGDGGDDETFLTAVDVTVFILFASF